jgi:hypothetical protein
MTAMTNQQPLVERLEGRISAVKVWWDATERQLDKDALDTITRLTAERDGLIAIIDEAEAEGFTPEIEQRLMDARATLKDSDNAED